MAWNDNNQTPWGGGNQTPPELDDIIKNIKDKFNKIFGGGNLNQLKPTKLTGNFKYVLILIVIVWLLFGIYIIKPSEKGVVLRFGAFYEETSAGPHWHLPYPIDTLLKVNVNQIRVAEIGYRGNNSSARRSNITSESRMLTKDENIIEAKFGIQYKIDNVRDFLFNTADPIATLRQVTESAIRQVVGQNTMDYILTEGRANISADIKDKSQELLNAYGTGLLITTVNMQDAQPPEQVQAAFNDAVKAREDKQRLINEAQTYTNDILPKARGLGVRIIEEAKAYKSKVIAQSEGETYRFNEILTEYMKEPEVTRERLYRETIESVLGASNKILVDSKSNSLMYLPIDKLISRESTSTNATTIKNNSNTTTNRNSIRNVFSNREAR